MWSWKADNPKGVIVIIHGAAEHHGRYKWLVEMWRNAGYHVVMGDLPGQGTSTRRRGHIDAFDEYIVVVNEWLKDAFSYDLPVFVLGHSMGGLIAIRALQEKHHKIAGVLLSSPCLGVAYKPNKAMEILSRGLNVVAPTFKVDSKLSIQLATRNKAVWEVDENDSLYVTKVSVRWYRELLEAIEQAHMQIGKFPDIPLLVMQGGEDKIVDKSAVKKWFNKVDISEKSFKEWPACYHEIFNEPEQEQVFKAARWFIDGLIEAGDCANVNS